MVRPERNNWRDERISKRHRHFWGEPCKCVDIDWLVLEYHLGKPVCLVEYKHHEWKYNPDDPNYAAIKFLADKCEIPFIIAVYWPETWAFRIIPMNDEADKYFTHWQSFTEFEFVGRLYKMRFITMGRHLRGKLNTVAPPENNHDDHF